MSTLTHRGRVTRICVGKLGHHWSRWYKCIMARPDLYIMARRMTIISTNVNAGLSLIGTMGTNFGEISMKIETSHSRKCNRRCHLQNGVIWFRPHWVNSDVTRRMLVPVPFVMRGLNLRYIVLLVILCQVEKMPNTPIIQCSSVIESLNERKWAHDTVIQYIFYSK